MWLKSSGCIFWASSFSAARASAIALRAAEASLEAWGLYGSCRCFKKGTIRPSKGIYIYRVL